MSETLPLPGVTPVPNRTLLTELELQSIREKLIESNGKIEVLGDNAMDIMRDVIYTCRMKANPMQEDPAVPKAPKKPKGESTNKVRSTGLDVNNLLG